MKNSIPKALTIAGSDSGGGAGIQADLKTFAALKVHGMAAVTSITAQNTFEVIGVYDVSPQMIQKQIDAVVRDLGVDAAKTGMLHTQEIIRAVSEKIEEYKFPVVVDPVMVAKSGAKLLKPDALEALTKYLIPLAKIVTPNAMEASVLTELKITNVEEAKKAALKIIDLGPEAVVVKGSHLKAEKKSIDVLYFDGEFHLFETERINTNTNHGTGCSFSAAIAAELAKKRGVVEAVNTAKKLVTAAIRFGLEIGHGHGPVNPLVHLYKEAEKYKIWRLVKESVKILEKHPEISSFVPEVGLNLAMALEYSENSSDIVAVPGRLRDVEGEIKAAACPEFKTSKHLSNYILTAREHDEKVRAAVNIKYSQEILSALEKLGLKISCYDRSKEPEEVKNKEGMSVPWGVKQIIKETGGVPDVIYHKGDIGKEPMIVLLGRNPVELVEKLLAASKVLVGGSEN